MAKTDNKDILEDLQELWDNIKSPNRNYTTNKRIKYNKKGVLLAKTLLLMGWICILFWLLKNGQKCFDSLKYIFLYIFFVFSVLIEIYWYVLFIRKLRNLSNCEDSIFIFDAKKNILLLMEKIEFLVSIFTAIPLYIFVLMPVIRYIISGADIYHNIIPIFIHRIPIILFAICIGIIYYRMNKQTIQNLKYEIENNNIKISWIWKPITLQ